MQLSASDHRTSSRPPWWMIRRASSAIHQCRARVTGLPPNQGERIGGVVRAECLERRLCREEVLRFRMQSCPWQRISAQVRPPPWFAWLVAYNHITPSTNRFGSRLVGWLVCSGCRPPNALRVTMQPSVALGLRDDGHEVEPARSDRPSRNEPGGGPILHARADVVFSVSSKPIPLGFDLVHRRDRAPLFAGRPLVVLFPEVGDVDGHGAFPRLRWLFYSTVPVDFY